MDESQAKATGSVDKNFVLSDALVASIVELVPEPGQLLTVAEDGKPFVLVPKGYDVKDLSGFLTEQPIPSYKQARFEVSDADSFIAYVNDHKIADQTVLACWINDDDCGFSVCFDWEQRGDKGVQGRKLHRATFEMVRDPDWSKWLAACNQRFSQATLADFFEDLDHTITDPDGGTLVDAVTEMRLASNVQFDSKIMRESGSVNFVYVDENQQKGEMRVPDKLEACCAPFVGGNQTDFLVRLRYRRGDGSITFTMVIDRPDKMEREVWEQTAAKIAEGTGLQVLRAPCNPFA